jgi:hypothetical protein
MDRLPDELLSEVLSCLGPSEIASFVTSNRSIYHHVHTMGCVSDAKSYRKAVSSNDWRTTYANHFLLARVPGSTGAVAFRLSPLYYGTHLSRKVILQTLTIAGEHGAALWVARHGNMPDPKPSSSGLHLFRSLPWDFLLYSMVCRAMVLSRLPTLRLHIRSIPGIMDRGQRLTASAQSFFCNLLWHARGKAIVLRLCGAPHELPHDPVTRAFIDEGRNMVDALFAQAKWAHGIRLYGEDNFRSSTVGLGVVMTTANPNLTALELSHYVFDEWGPSLDAAYFTSWLSWGKHSLARVHFHCITFSRGVDFCDLVEGLCRVKTLHSVRLSFVEYLSDAPVDPVLLLFEQGVHLKDVRLANVMRTHTEFPFHALHSNPGFRSLGLSRMFLDSAGVKALTLMLPKLPHLLTLDLSSNGIDGASLAMFSSVLVSNECSLQRLKLSSNIITSTTVASFCDALSRNKSLVALDLSDNFLGTQSSLAILQAMLSQNIGRLKTLNLDSNQIRLNMDDLYRQLLSAPTGNFRQVTLRSNPINIEKRDDLGKYKAFFLETFCVSFHF